jgi:hypothetical protein
MAIFDTAILCPTQRECVTMFQNGYFSRHASVRKDGNLPVGNESLARPF